MSELTRAELVEAFEYLDELRESGRTNMWGAPAYMQAELAWPKAEASEAFKLWRETFDGESAVDARVTAAAQIHNDYNAQSPLPAPPDNQ